MLYNSINYTLYYRVFKLIKYIYKKFVYWSCKSQNKYPCITLTKIEILSL